MNTRNTKQDRDASDGAAYRLAQARRLTRFCQEQGLDPHTSAQKKLDPILDPAGKIIPEPEVVI